MGIAKQQGGFTLVEIMIVLAISSLLLAVAFLGQGPQRQFVQFSTDIDSIVNNLREVQSEAASGVTYPGSVFSYAPTGTTDYQFYGKQVELWTDHIREWTIIKDRDPAASSASSCGALGALPGAAAGLWANGLCQVDENDVPYGSDVTFADNPAPGTSCLTPLIYFTYGSSSGSGQMGTPFCNPDLSSGGQPESFRLTRTYHFNQVGGPHTATIIVDPAANTVTRTIQ